MLSTITTIRPRLFGLLALIGVSGALSACGGSDAAPKAAAGTQANPLAGKITAEKQAARTGEPAANSASEAPGYQKLLEKQPTKPQSDFTPCNLVSPAQAKTILGGAIQAPLEAPQGPTCIYRTKSGKDFVTVSVQSSRLSALKKQMRDPLRVTVSGRDAYCGLAGQPMLYAGLADGRVLAVGARCKVARQFAAKAVARLPR